MLFGFRFAETRYSGHGDNAVDIHIIIYVLSNILMLITRLDNFFRRTCIHTQI